MSQLEAKKYCIPKDKKLRIAVSGKSGCGNTTVSTMLSQRLGISLINYTFRSLSVETGLTLAQIIERARHDDSFDITVDTRQVELAKRDSCVLGSRLAVWMLKEADFKVYLYTDETIRAQRIMKREGGSLEDVLKFTRHRDTEDSTRYKKLYNIDNNSYDFCNLVVDTSNYSAEQLTEIILEKLLQADLIKESV